jgi:hypothetical protein
MKNKSAEKTGDGLRFVGNCFRVIGIGLFIWCILLEARQGSTEEQQRQTHAQEYFDGLNGVGKGQDHQKILEEAIESASHYNTRNQWMILWAVLFLSSFPLKSYAKTLDR